VQKVFLEQYTQAKINLLIVWLKMYGGDTLVVVNKASRLFSADPRVTQFYDRENLAGMEVAVGLEAKSEEVAWDVYLFFGGEDEWLDILPQPVDWVHQLKNSSWAIQERLYQGEKVIFK